MEKNFCPVSRTLSFFDSGCRSYGVTWHTEISGNPVIKYGRADSSERIIIEGITEKGSGDFVNRAVMKNLDPDTDYVYAIGCGEYFAEEISFHTVNPNNNPMFLFVTDSQEYEQPGRLFKITMDAAMKRFNPAFILHGGDIVQHGGEESHWIKMLGSVEKHLTSCPTMPAAGNHDYWDGYLYGNSHVTKRHFTIDLPGQDTTHGIYYSFDCGEFHFSVLNSGDSVVSTGLNGAQLDWLENDLMKTDKKWKIVMIHNPMYSPGKYGSVERTNGVALALRPQLNPLFAKYGVDLCLNGHDHVYSKTYPIAGDGSILCDYKKTNISPEGKAGSFAVCPEGTIHMMGGCCGDQHRESEAAMAKYIYPLEEFHCVSWGTMNYTAISVTDNTLYVEYYIVDGNTGNDRLAHRWGIIK